MTTSLWLAFAVCVIGLEEVFGSDTGQRMTMDNWGFRNFCQFFQTCMVLLILCRHRLL